MLAPFKCLLISTLGISAVSGHGWMTKPAATFDNAAGDKSQFIATIDSSTSGFKGTFNTAPADNVASFTKAFKASKYKSLKALIDDKAKITVTGATLTCGIAEPTAAAQPLPAKLEWSHSDSEGFTPSHEGPCEAWCDDVRVFEDENCAANFKTAPAEMPYEQSKCSGAKKLTFYWIAMHGPSWQVYVNCANLGSGGSTTQESGSTSTTTTDSSSADTPTVTSATQTSSSENSPSTTTAPSTTTTDSSTANTPTVTSAPSTGTGGSPSTTTTSTTAPSTSTTTEDSDCGSYDVAGSDESECGSYDVAGGSGDEGQDTAQTTQGSTNTGTQSETNTESQANTYQQGGTNTATNTGTQTNTGSSTNQYWKGGDNTNQYWNGGGNTNQWGGGNTNQWGTGSQANTNQGTGSQTSFDFNTFKGATNTGTGAGTVSPQKM